MSTDFAQTPARKRTDADGVLTTPKSGQSRRVDMSPQLTATLKALLLEQKKETFKRGWGLMPPVGAYERDRPEPRDPDNFRNRVWPKLLKKTDLRHIRIHDLQHTSAILFIQQGESPWPTSKTRAVFANHPTQQDTEEKQVAACS